MMPVEPTVLAAFLVAVTAIILSPGPDTMVILRHTLSSGRRVGLAAVAGVQLGLVLHTALAVAGISLIIAPSPVLYRGRAGAAAAYRAWLGAHGFRDSGALTLGADRSAVSAARACREAAVTNVLNPKVILLFLALFPNFVDTGRDDVTAQLLTLAAVLIFINVLWQAPLTWAADAVRQRFTQPRTQRVIARVSGAILIGFAALLLYEHLF